MLYPYRLALLSIVRLLVPVLLFLLAGPAFGQDIAKLENAFPNLSFDRPLYFHHIPGRTGKVVVVEQAGKVFSFPQRRDVTPEEMSTIIDVNARRKGNEEGLLGLAFDPEYPENRHVYLHFSASDPVRNVLARYTMNEDHTELDPDSEVVILEVEQPWGNHNGGMIDFGPDGMLYLALGDGGSGGDPKNSGQDLSTLLGTILRINPRIEPGTGVDGANYAIPEDNPFVGVENARPEIWAWGLRNVWRFSFDPENGDLWAGDVGQNKYEEIDLITRGGNYGWNIREGMHPFRKGSPPDGVRLIEPIVEYPRKEGQSVTGGYVYRGESIPLLRGAYIYADYQSGKVWALWYDGSSVRQQRELLRVKFPSSFGTDAAGELYVCSFDGSIYKFVPGGE